MSATKISARRVLAKITEVHKKVDEIGRPRLDLCPRDLFERLEISGLPRRSGSFISPGGLADRFLDQRACAARRAILVR